MLPATPGEPPTGQGGTCTPGPTTACLYHGRFEVKVEGDSGLAQVVPIDKNTVGFGFGNLDWSVLTKILYGCSVNDHFWVFLSRALDVEYVMTVTDTHAGDAKYYLDSLNGFPRTIPDTSASATCP